MPWTTKHLGLLAGGAVLMLAPAARAADAPKRCAPAGMQVVSVELAPPTGTPLVGVKLRLDYPEAAVDIPGSADGTEVRERVRDMPSGVLGVPNDEGGRLIVAMVSNAPLPAGRILTIAFDRCGGSSAPTATQFPCTVDEASDERAQLVGGARCTVTLIKDEEGAKT